MIRIAEPLTGWRTSCSSSGPRFRSRGGRAGLDARRRRPGRRPAPNFNVVPGSAWFSLDRRFNPEEELDEELERLTGTIAEAAEAPAPRSTVEVLQRAARPASTDRPTPPPRRSPAASRRSRAPRRAFQLCPGVLDTRWYSQLGIPAFAYGGGRLDVSHGPDEYIDEAAMRRCAAVYALFAGAL